MHYVKASRVRLACDLTHHDNRFLLHRFDQNENLRDSLPILGNVSVRLLIRRNIYRISIDT